MPPKIFIDGEAGTTGLQIRETLADVAGVALVSLPAAQRKDVEAKKSLLNDVDVVILCLPDGAAKETVALIDDLTGPKPRIIDASTAHRVAPGWTYGYPELTAGQAAAIAAADRVANPGCYATGAIALLRPLVEAELIPPAYPLTINAVSGYSGGGKTMIEAYEAGSAPAFELYGLAGDHKHLPEIAAHSGLTRRPIFVPSVGNFKQGMLVSIPIWLDQLPGKPDLAALSGALAKHYAGSTYVSVLPFADQSHVAGRLEALSLNGTNFMQVHVFGNQAHGQAVLVAKLDNLGKGASGAAVQNLKLMLGIAEKARAA